MRSICLGKADKKPITQNTTIFLNLNLSSRQFSLFIAWGKASIHLFRSFVFVLFQHYVIFNRHCDFFLFCLVVVVVFVVDVVIVVVVVVDFPMFDQLF